ncbi:M20/M25/M40 family metallo-hydrolase [Robertkochia marina]|uniref:M20/M25/M40 family metallo-hydrolase n=1 Tax=Robertkochia marina TaxID=1227945 RepID=A0A4S3LZT4_9FLAO|nr:M20 family metallo-hydrolase [Robertkochia marina]THD67660.1 M20/M25/M40 family metallo-hydrolase [Robertkochia marina]TRZ43392.1 M20/M25/M40 family metallo-hydrolase [Robertkochia marina]
MSLETLKKEALELLTELVETPSFSKEEHNTAKLLEAWFEQHQIPFHRENNNLWAFNKHYKEGAPLLLLNSHHDTVKPNVGYTRDPFMATLEDGKLFGLGSNDAGGCLVSLLAVFTWLYDQKNLNYNLVMVASAEEENSGANGLNSVLKSIPAPDVAIVGEPTQMQLAIAEKGLVVFDATIAGTPGHAAHPNDNNAIYNTIEVLQWFKDYKFEKSSDLLGDVKLTVSQIQAGTQHNVVPAAVKLVIDVRVNEKYSNAEINEILQNEAPCSIEPRSLRLGSSSIPEDHPLVQAGINMGRKTYGSPTLSDQAVLSCPSLKLGPGDSTRSHSADEFIYVDEIFKGIDIYAELLESVLAKKSVQKSH